MRSAAAVIADLLPAETAKAIRRITGNRELATVDEYMQPVANPALPQIASELPADAAFQITRTAERLGFTDYSDVLAEVANAVIRQAANPKGNSYSAAPVLEEASFPRPLPAVHVSAQSQTARTSITNSLPKPPQSKC
jgi:hypothetical protein